MQIRTKIVSCHTADSKPVKQEVNGAVHFESIVWKQCTKFTANLILLGAIRDAQKMFMKMTTAATAATAAAAATSEQQHQHPPPTFSNPSNG